MTRSRRPGDAGADSPVQMQLSTGSDPVPAPRAMPGSNESPYTVAQVCSGVTRAVQSEFGGPVWVQGEIVLPNRHQTATGHAAVTLGQHHVYFQLVEPANNVATANKLEVALFKGSQPGIKAKLDRAGLELADGLAVNLRGKIGLYGPRSQIQLVVDDIDANFTTGKLALDRQAILERLTRERVTEWNRAVAKPMLPLRVGLVTRVDSDGYKDVINRLTVSRFGFDVVVADSLVQGPGAPSALIAALQRLAALDPLPDVVVICRGGGGRTDLATFDNEALARAVAAMPVPVIAGIGHTADQSMVDACAAVVRTTPTQCAEFLIQRVEKQYQRFDSAGQEISRQVSRLFAQQNDRVADAESRLPRAAAATVAVAATRLEHVRSAIGREAKHATDTAKRAIDGLHERLDKAGPSAAKATATRLAEIDRRVTQAASTQLQTRTRELDRLTGAIDRAAPKAYATSAARLDDVAHKLTVHARHQVQQASTRLEVLAAHADARDPQRILERGFSLTQTADGRVVRDADTVDDGTVVITQLAHGRLISVVTDAVAGPAGDARADLSAGRGDIDARKEPPT